MDRNGGSKKPYPKNNVEILKQPIWGNKFIKFKGKMLTHRTWINSGILYIKDIVDENGTLNERTITEKLINKSNLISELPTLKKAIPKIWKYTTSFAAIKVWTQFLTYIGKTSCQILKKRFNDSFQFIFHTLKDNKLKMFRWKLAHIILVNTENLYKWKIATSLLCKICKQTDNYNHFFIDCNFVSNFCKQMNQILHSLGFKERMITLENITLGYKIYDPKFHEINTLLTLISFSVYKGYYASELKENPIEVMAIFRSELQMYIQLMTHFKISARKQLQKVWDLL